MARTVLAVALMTAAGVSAAEPRVDRDVEYANIDGHRLLLDVHHPTVAAMEGKPRLVVWVHGGAWRGGSRDDMPLTGLLGRGYAIASVEYRLSPVAKFPAQVHDLKAAVRFLRANADRFGFDAARVAVAGSSAGGHLAALVGVTNGHGELEGAVGGHGGVSSDVAAIVNLYGPTDLTTILSQSTPHGLSVRVPALRLLLGGPPDEVPDLARLASPVAHVDPSDSPLLIVHGDRDPQVPINQAHQLEGEYERHGLPVVFEVVHGGAHGGPAFYDEERTALIADFLDRSLDGTNR